MRRYGKRLIKKISEVFPEIEVCSLSEFTTKEWSYWLFYKSRLLGTLVIRYDYKMFWLSAKSCNRIKIIPSKRYLFYQYLYEQLNKQ